MVTCSSIVDMCIPATGTTLPRHAFSVSISNGQFTLRINPVSPNTDVGVYKEHGRPTDSDNMTLDTCGKFLVFNERFLISGDVQISVIYGKEPSYQCLIDNNDITLTCTVNILENVVKWYHDTTYMGTCSNHINLCIPAGGTTANLRHNFTSSVANGEFTLRINPVSSDNDTGVYKCAHGGLSDSATVTFEACGKCPCILHVLPYFR